jgi:tripartite-type tricarboxylate transporter receptor subunit TctC
MHLLRALAAALLISVMGGPGAWAQAPYPSKPIKIVVPFAPGGTSDNLARAMAALLQGRLGVAVYVDNKPGASGAIAIQAVAKAPADGYTLLWGSDSLIVQPLLRKDFPVDTLRELEPLVQVGYTPMLILVNKDAPIADIKQLVARAKAAPGALRYGSGGAGTVLHITGERFKLAAGIDMIHVPYKGTGPAMLDAVGGHIEVVIAGVAEAISQVRHGDLRALAYTGDTRYAGLPEVPTVAESGLPGFFAAGWQGVVAPASLPPLVATLLADELYAVAQSPEFQKVSTTAGMVGVLSRRPETGHYLRAQSERYREAIEKANIKAE